MVSILEIIVIAIGLAMDAFAVSICKGLLIKENKYKKALIVGLYFGIFQGLMPIFGYYLAIVFKDIVVAIDHWIAFILLLLIGSNMIKESLSKNDDEHNDSVRFKDMIWLSIATSIDALAVGITFAFFDAKIYLSALIILLITLGLTFIGVLLGSKAKDKLGKKAELVGGLILILMGIKILIEHLGFFII